jgi:hypothetical protein
MNAHARWITITLAFLVCFGADDSTALAQDTVFTYQGRLLANGTNFTGAGQFKFALVTGTNTSHQATATANLSGQFVVSYTVTAGGNGYLSAPAVSVIGGGGSGATAHSTISGGVVTSVVADNAGSGYNSAPTVTVAPPPPSIAYTTWWSNDGTSVGGSEPSAAIIVGVSNGLFTVAMGDTTVVNMTAINASLFAAQPHLQLRIWFDDGVSGFAALSPPQVLSPAPYAVVAASANGLVGALSAAQLTSIGNTNAGASANFFVGPSGNSTVSGSANTAYGVSALLNNTSGSENTASGWSALYSNTTGSYDTANGLNALFNNSIGAYNAANGAYALFNNTIGGNNTADGSWALSGNTSGSNNIAVGYQAGINITTGSFNIDIGNPGASSDTNIIRIGSGQSQAFIAGVLNGNGSGLTSLSAAALTSVGNGNFFVGQSGNPDTGGFDNTAIGDSALYRNSSANFNTAEGCQALFSNTSGYENTANGAFALSSNTNGSLNTAEGVQSLVSNTSGSFNTAEGVQALFSNTSGFYNTANGAFALGYNTNGAFNTAEGAEALLFNTSGSENTASGQSALYSNTIGSFNIAVGFLAGLNNTTGSSNIDIGNQGAATDTNIIRIGSGQTATYLAGTVYASNVQLSGTVPSATSGFSQTLTPKNLIAAWGLVKVTTSGTISIINGFNVASVGNGGTFLQVTFAAALNTANYGVLVQDGRPDTGGFPTAITYSPDFYSGQRSAGFFLLRSDAVGNWSAPPRDVTFTFLVIGG